MKGIVTSIEGLGGGFRLTVEVPSPEFEPGKDLYRLHKEERLRWINSPEYKAAKGAHHKLLRELEKAARLGEVEIIYQDER